ncbi:MAG TPA: hypothetical protein VGP76_24450 [Planctomycetaceae bacterium]|nr:hypothetical protein [Planctomycetaceae bacterium]
MDNRATCGKITITYPPECSYVCYCTPQSGCQWAVTCGTWTTGGKGIVAERPLKPHVTLAGKLEVCVKILEQRWKRSVIVPTKLRGQTIRKRTLKGTPEQIAHALGVELGPKLKR